MNTGIGVIGKLLLWMVGIALGILAVCALVGFLIGLGPFRNLNRYLAGLNLQERQQVAGQMRFRAETAGAVYNQLNAAISQLEAIPSTSGADTKKFDSIIGDVKMMTASLVSWMDISEDQLTKMQTALGVHPAAPRDEASRPAFDNAQLFQKFGQEAAKDLKDFIKPYMKNCETDAMLMVNRLKQVFDTLGAGLKTDNAEQRKKLYSELSEARMAAQIFSALMAQEANNAAANAK